MNFFSDCRAKVAEATAFCKEYIPKIGNSQQTANTVVNTSDQPASKAPVKPQIARQLKTNRGLLKLIIFSGLTFGIYGLIVMTEISKDINTIASKYDEQKTMHFCLMLFIFSWLTLGIAPLVWYHKISRRIGEELERRNIDYGFGALTFWSYGFVGQFFCIGPFIYFYELLKAMNLLSADYKAKGC